MNTVTICSAFIPLFQRGAVIEYASTGEASRVIRVAPNVLTVRPLHRSPVIEAVRFAWERYIAWPVTDWLARVRGV